MPDAPQDTSRLPVHVDLHSVPLNMWQTLRAARRNLLDIIPRQTTEETIISGKTGRPWHIIMDPDAIRRVVLQELDAYPKSDITKVLFRPAVGDSLFIAEGDHWRWQRRTTAPVFTHRDMMNLSPSMTRAAVAATATITDTLHYKQAPQSGQLRVERAQRRLIVGVSEAL